MKIITFNNVGGIDHNESNFTRTSASVTDGEAVIKRRIYFQAEAVDEDAIDILGLDIFPKKFSAHPKHPAYKYYGNATISPISEKSKYWVAELEYSTDNPNASAVEPWKLKPDNISLVSSEVTVPFRYSYDANNKTSNEKGDPVNPVCNSAGDMYEEQKTARNLELSFSFAVRNWNSDNLLTYINSINSKQIKVAGLNIPAGQGLLKSISPNFVTVYEDNSTQVKWEYWQISVTILIDASNTVLERKLLDIGDRAKFRAKTLTGDALLSAAKLSNTTLPETSSPSQICRFRLANNIAASGEPANYAPIGDIVLCSWEQYLAAVKMYRKAARIVGRSNESARNYMPEVEQLQQMPLDGKGYLYYQAIQGLPEYEDGTTYKIRRFREYPMMSWASLNLPREGID